MYAAEFTSAAYEWLRNGEKIQVTPSGRCIPHALLKSSATCYPSRAFSPAVSCGGEGADRRMRGPFTSTRFARELYGNVNAGLQAVSDKRRQITHSRVRPPHPPPAPSPPAKNRGGRRALDERTGSAQEGSGKCGLRWGYGRMYFSGPFSAPLVDPCPSAGAKRT